MAGRFFLIGATPKLPMGCIPASTTVKYGCLVVSSKDIKFRRIPDIPGGVELVVVDDVFESLPPEDDRSELGWLIVETGLGEEISSRITHIEFTSASSGNSAESIGRLMDFARSLPAP